MTPYLLSTFPPKHFAALLAQSEISQRAFHKVNLLKAILWEAWHSFCIYGNV